ncbi:MAG: thioredoxin family protein, partial [Planctomycetota bacterium]|nr:thioredoxin family protein [Planctomycetota bacterium]
RTSCAVAIFLAVATAPAPASAQPRGAQVDTWWVFETDAAHPGTTIHAALKVNIHGNFHVQSNKPLDEFLIPTVLTVSPPKGFTVRTIVYPEPVMIKVPGLDEPQPGFEQEFVIGVALEVGRDVEPGVYPINISLRYQACDDRICLAPTTRELASVLQVVPESEPIVESPLFDKPCAEEPEAGVTLAPPASETRVAILPDADLDIMAELKDFEILQTAGGYLNVEDFIQFIDDAESGTAQAGWFEDKGPLVILLLVILGGIALNLTPCVLPLIPINLAIIGAGAQAGSRTRGFALGGTYGLAMAAVYGTLGLVVTLTAATFGAINSTIWFNVGIAILFVVLGLAMLDVLAIDFSKLQGKLDLAGKGKRGTFALAFGMGGISALLAGACVAPVVIQVIVYSSDQYAKGTTMYLALPFFLGLGMALPWPFAGGGLSFLPKPGPWMVRVKQAMGVFILVFAAYYGYSAWKIYDSTNVQSGIVQAAVEARLKEAGWTGSLHEGLAQAKAENKLVFIDMWATWCKNCFAMDKTTFEDEQVIARMEEYVKIKFQAQPYRDPFISEIRKHLGEIGLPHYAVLRPRAPEEGNDRQALSWQDYSAQRLQAALDDNKVAVVLVGANWARESFAMSKTLDDQHFSGLLRESDIELLKAELNPSNPEHRALMDNLDLVGVTAIAIMTSTLAEPIVFRGFLPEPAVFGSALDQAREAN